jgi:glycosyltransferase involved in cell wall biosynthesis
MNKPVLVFQGPSFTRSGYGDHSRDLLRALRKLDKYDIKIVPLRWGNTPQNQANPETEFGRWMLERVITNLPQKPDVFVQVSVANEFQPRGHYNIGVTAGVETTIIPKDFVDGANRMDLIIVPSKFTKDVMVSTVYQEKNKQTDQVIGEHKIVKPVEVLFEGVNEEIFGKSDGVMSELDKLETDWNFLIVGHWLKGDLGQDRKDIGMSIKTIATVFQYLPEDKRPGIVIKTSQAGFSLTDREIIRERINTVLSPLGNKVIPVHLVHGDLSEGEMSALYHHPKIKAMVSFTKGEGYGRPLAEFALTGKPIIVSKWSGLVDFLPEENTVYLDGTLNHVHPSSADQFLMKEAKWFGVNYSDAANKLFDVFNNYSQHLKRSAGLRGNILNKFTMEGMIKRMGEIMDGYVKEQPKMMPLNLPKLNKIELPKLNKI